MAVTNLLKTQVDQPVFEWMRFAPVATAAGSLLAAGDDATGRFMYYLNSTALYSYDTHADSWQQLATAPAAVTSPATMKYTRTLGGFRGDALAGTSTTITIGGLSRAGMVGQTIRIIAGTGAGQERTISSVADAVIADFGVVTAVSGALSLSDSTKKWRVNQWDNYSCRIVMGAGVGQVRRIAYNDTTTLTFSDPNYQPINPFENQAWSASSPYAIPVTTAGSQSHYVIESCVLTVPTWTVTPDVTSEYQVLGGGLWVASATSPNIAFQFYDILTDTWMTKTNMGGLVTSTVSTDIALERIGEIGTAFVSGLTASSATSRTLVDSGATYELDRYANHQIRITSGTGIGQKRRIVGHTATTFYTERNWGVTPDSTSQYAIYGDTDAIWFIGNANSSIMKYSVEGDIWSTSHTSDMGIARNMSATPASGAGYEAPHPGFAITSIVRVTTGLTALAINNGGLGYVVGDLVTISVGTAGQAWVTGVNSSGSVTSLELAASGSGYSTTTGIATTGGSGGATLVVNTTAGTTALVTTAMIHDFKTGDILTIAGCATDTWFNTNHTPIGYGSTTTFSINATGSTSSPTAASSQSTTVLVDSAKAWITNEHVGKLCHIHIAGTAPTTQTRRISANTATTLTVGAVTAITTPTNGTSRYTIAEPSGFGAMQTNRIATKGRAGWATSGTATTLVDSTKNWNNGQWTNCRVRVMSGTGVGNESVITGNSATSLTVASWANATPDATSKYEIMDSFGVVTTGGASTTVTDANKNWTTNILAGKRFRILAGTGIGNDILVVSNTATVITLASTVTTDTTTMYVIYEAPARSTGTAFMWLYGLTDTNRKGRWMFSPRGGASNIHDIYDIPSNTWDISPFFAVNSETFTTGSMYTYDGLDDIIMTKDATGRIYELNMNTFKINPCGICPYAHSTAIIGQRMELIKTADGLQYIYMMRHTGQEMWRTLKFW